MHADCNFKVLKNLKTVKLHQIKIKIKEIVNQIKLQNIWPLYSYSYIVFSSIVSVICLKNKKQIKKQTNKIKTTQNKSKRAIVYNKQRFYSVITSLLL